MNDRPFADYRYSAFFSFATGDDEAWNAWVTKFETELNYALPGRLRGYKAPPIHMSGIKPLVSGSLGEQLSRNIQDSFAMFLFVHENYLASEWCLRELEYFKSLFGEDGFRDRLYVIAMSKPAIDELVQRDNWKKLCPFDDQIWMRFYQGDDEDFPVTIYGNNDRDKKVMVSPEFWDYFVPVRESLAKKIRAAVESGRRVPAYPTTAPERPAVLPEDPLLVRVYIEDNKEQEKYWAALGKQVEASWEQVVNDLKIEPHLYLRPTGLKWNEVEERPMLDDADGVVLLGSKKTPDSLAAQIKKVEPKLSGPNCAPGVIVYLLESEAEIRPANSVGNWRVLRFTAGADGSMHVLPEDSSGLQDFLNSVLERKRKRIPANAERLP